MDNKFYYWIELNLVKLFFKIMFSLLIWSKVITLRGFNCIFSFSFGKKKIAFALTNLRPCIPNFKPNIRVGTSFSWFSKFEFNVIFRNFWKVWNWTNFEIFVSSEFSETAVFNPKTGVSKLFDPLKHVVFRPKNRKLFPNFFCKIFTRNLRKQKVWKFLRQIP